MSELKATGKITEVSNVKEGVSKAGKGWKSLSFVINNGSEYNSEAEFTLFGADKVDNFTKYNKVGDNVDVTFNINLRRTADGKKFQNLDAWKVFKAVAEGVDRELVEDGNGLPF